VALHAAELGAAERVSAVSVAAPFFLSFVRLLLSVFLSREQDGRRGGRGLRPFAVFSTRCGGVILLHATWFACLARVREEEVERGRWRGRGFAGVQQPARARARARAVWRSTIPARVVCGRTRTWTAGRARERGACCL
jgi:hypothetical protein